MKQMQEHKNDKTCTDEHYSLFVVRHIETARLDSLDTLVSTRSTKSNVLSRVESSRDEPSGIWAKVCALVLLDQSAALDAADYGIL